MRFPEPFKLAQMFGGWRGRQAVFFVSIGTLLATVVPTVGRAQTSSPLYWDAVSGTWNTTASNWVTSDGGAALSGPLGGNDVVFNYSGVTGSTTVGLSAAQAADGLYFVNTGTSLLESSSATSQVLSVGSDGITINAAAGAATLGNATNQMPLLVGGSQSWTNNSGNALTVVNSVSLAASVASPSFITLSGTSTSVPNVISGAISNGGTAGASLGLTVNSGIWQLSGSNNFSGGVNVNGGVLNFNTAGALPSASAVTQSGSGQIMLQSSGTYNNAFTLAGSGGVTNFDPNQAGYSGGGAMWLNANGGNFVFNGPITIAGNGANTEIAAYSSATTIAINGGISGGGNLVLAGGGTSNSTTQTFVVSGSNTYTGNTLLIGHSVNSILRIGGSNTLPTSTTLTLQGDNNNSKTFEGWLDLNGNNQQLAGLTAASGSLTVPNAAGDNRVVNTGTGTPTLTISPSGVDLFAGTLGGGTPARPLSSSFNLSIAGNGTLALTGTNTYSGITTIGIGSTLQVGNGGITGSLGTSSVVDNGTLLFDLSTGIAVTGNISGSGALQQIGTGTTTISGANSLSGPTTVSAGALELNSYPTRALAGSISVGLGGAVGAGSKFISGDPNPASATPLSSYFLPLINTSSTGAIALASNSGENLDFSNAGFDFTAASLGAIGSAVYSGTLTPNGGMYRLGGGGGGLTFATALRDVSGPTALAVAAPGTVALTNATSTYSGGTAIIGGSLLIGSDTTSIGAGSQAELGQVPVAPTTNIAINGGTLEATGTFTLNPNRGIALGPATGSSGGGGTIGVAGQSNFTFGGVIADNFGGPGALTTSGGTIILTGVNTYTGGTTITNGTVEIQSKQGLGIGPITILNATLELTGGATFTQPLTMGSLNGNNGGFLSSGGGNNTYSGQITPLAQIQVESTVVGNNLTLSAPINLSAGALVNGAGNITISGSVTSNGVNEIFFGGSGTLTLSGQNSGLAGNIFIDGGSLLLQTNSAGGTGGIYADGGTLKIGAGVTVGTSLIIGSNAPSGLQSVADGSYHSPVSLRGPATIGSLLAGATLFLDDYLNLGFTSGQTGNPLVFNGPGNIMVSGPIYDLSSSPTLNTITYSGTGSLTFAGSNIYSAGTTIASGLVVTSSTTSLGSGPVTLAGGSLKVSATAGATISGFGGNGFDALGNASSVGTPWHPNASLTFANNFFPSQDVLQIMDTSSGQSRIAFFALPIPIANNQNGFIASFTYMHASGTSNNSGFAFVLQNDSRNIDAIGGLFGYGTGHGATPIAASIGIELGTSGSNGSVGTALGVDGTTPALISTGAVNLASGDPINVTIAYNPVALTLTETLTDTISRSTFSTVYAGENLASILGSNSAYLGFTGSTGSSGTTAPTLISNFTYSNLSTAGQYTNNVVLNPGISSTIYVAPNAVAPTVTMGTLTVAAGTASTLSVASSTASVGQSYGLVFSTTTLNSNVTFNVANNTSGGGNALGTLTLGPVGQSGGMWGLTKAGAGELLLSGASTYTGPTSIGAGSLALAGASGSLGNTAISVSSGATFAATPGSGVATAGTPTAGNAGATLTLNSGSNFGMNDSAIGTFGLQQEASFTGAALTLSGATLDFDLSNSGSDQLTVSKAASVTGSNTINLVGLGSSLKPGTYPLISAASGLNGSGFQFANAATTENVAVGGHAYALTLNNSATTESVTVATLSGATADTSNRPAMFGPQVTASITSGSSFAGISSTVSGGNGTTNPGPGPLTGTTGGPIENSVAAILAGANNQIGNIEVSMAWRTRNTNETPATEGGAPASPPLPGNSGSLISDVLNMQLTGEPTVTDAYALDITYDPKTVGAIVKQNALVNGGSLYLGWLNPNGADTGIPEWTNAVNGDTLIGADAQTGVINSFAQWASANGVIDSNLASFVGSWGVDTTNDQAWAIVDHASDFAVVPEPSSLALAALGLLGGLVLIRGKSVAQFLKFSRICKPS